MTVSLDDSKLAPAGGIEVTFTVTGTATEGTDYGAIGTTVTIAEGDNSATVDVAGIVDDDIVENGGETVILTLDSTDNGGVGRLSAANTGAWKHRQRQRKQE